MKDPRRWLLPIGGVAVVLSLVLAGRGGSAKGGPGFSCLTHVDCAKALACVSNRCR